jgi:hypothetical protein
MGTDPGSRRFDTRPGDFDGHGTRVKRRDNRHPSGQDPFIVNPAPLDATTARDP